MEKKIYWIDSYPWGLYNNFSMQINFNDETTIYHILYRDVSDQSWCSNLSIILSFSIYSTNNNGYNVTMIIKYLYLNKVWFIQTVQMNWSRPNIDQNLIWNLFCKLCNRLWVKNLLKLLSIDMHENKRLQSFSDSEPGNCLKIINQISKISLLNEKLNRFNTVKGVKKFEQDTGLWCNSLHTTFNLYHVFLLS